MAFADRTSGQLRLERFFQTEVGKGFDRRFAYSPLAKLLLVINELCAQSKITDEMRITLKNLTLQGDPTILGLSGAYEVEHDKEELIDSLIKLTKKLEIDGVTAKFDSYHPPAEEQIAAPPSSSSSSTGVEFQRGAESTLASRALFFEPTTSSSSSSSQPKKLSQQQQTPAAKPRLIAVPKAAPAFAMHPQAIPFPSLLLPTTSSSSFSSSFIAPEERNWVSVDETAAYVLSMCDKSESSRRNLIAGFDLDETLVRPRNGGKFAQNASDWEFLFEEKIPNVIVNKLRSVYATGRYHLAIFSNQKGISAGKQTKADVLGRINQIITSIGVPVCAYVSCAADSYRKPELGLWKLLPFTCKIKPTEERGSFFVGDAAGREGDFSAADRKFASNAGLAFATPEEFFLSEAPRPFSWGSVPNEIVQPPLMDGSASSSASASSFSSSSSSPTSTYHSTSQEMIIMLGFPGSGKSTFTKKHFLPFGYVHVNRDTLKTEAACLSMTREAIRDGKSVVIDNTNPSAATRQLYINIAKEKGIPVRCFQMQTDEAMAKHLNAFRERKGESVRVPAVAYSSYSKKFDAPMMSEGFSEVIAIPFAPRFENSNDEKLFRQVS